MASARMSSVIIFFGVLQGLLNTSNQYILAIGAQKIPVSSYSLFLKTYYLKR